jgi:hypothetical protein
LVPTAAKPRASWMVAGKTQFDKKFKDAIGRVMKIL